MTTAFHEHEGEVACTGLEVQLSEGEVDESDSSGPPQNCPVFPGDHLFRATSRLGLSLEAAGSTLRNTADLKHLGYTIY